MTFLTEFTGSVIENLIVAGFIFLRIGFAIMVAPGYGERTVSPRVRAVLGLTVSVAMVPALEPYVDNAMATSSQLYDIVVVEAFIGIFIGLVSRGILFLLDTAGKIISQVVSLSQMFADSGEQHLIFSHILIVSGLSLFFANGLQNDLLKVLYWTYEVQLPPLSELNAFFSAKKTEIANWVFKQAFVLATPIIAVVLIYYLVMGLTNRTMPQFMVSFIGIPFVALLSIWLLFGTSQNMLTSWMQRSRMMLLSALRVLNE